MSETAIAVRDPGAIAHNGSNVPATPAQMFTAKQLETIKTTIARGATDEEFDLFIATCTRLGLDPFRPGEIYFIKRKVRKKVAGEWVSVDVASIQPGIEYFRIQAESNPAYECHTPTFWCGEDGRWVDVWLSDKPPAACKVGIYRKGAREPVWGIARYKSFVQMHKDSNTQQMVPSGMWATMPEHMLALVAEKQAIRRALPRLAEQLAREEPGLFDDDTAELPAMVDGATGEVLDTGSRAYTDVKDNERLMRRLHAVARDRRISHDDLHRLGLAITNEHHRTHGLPELDSLKDLTLRELEGFVNFVDRTSAEALSARVAELTATAEDAPIDVEVVDELPADRPSEAATCRKCDALLTAEQAQATAADGGLCPDCAFQADHAAQAAPKAPKRGRNQTLGPVDQADAATVDENDPALFA